MKYILTCSGCFVDDYIVAEIADELHDDIMRIVEERGITLDQFVSEAIANVNSLPGQNLEK